MHKFVSKAISAVCLCLSECLFADCLPERKNNVCLCLTNERFCLHVIDDNSWFPFDVKNSYLFIFECFQCLLRHLIKSFVSCLFVGRILAAICLLISSLVKITFSLIFIGMPFPISTTCFKIILKLKYVPIYCFSIDVVFFVLLHQLLVVVYCKYIYELLFIWKSHLINSFG